MKMTYSIFFLILKWQYEPLYTIQYHKNTAAPFFNQNSGDATECLKLSRYARFTDVKERWKNIF